MYSPVKNYAHWHYFIYVKNGRDGRLREICRNFSVAENKNYLSLQLVNGHKCVNCNLVAFRRWLHFCPAYPWQNVYDFSSCVTIRSSWYSPNSFRKFHGSQFRHLQMVLLVWLDQGWHPSLYVLDWLEFVMLRNPDEYVMRIFVCHLVEPLFQHLW